jgi:hypothetical protein
VSSDLGARGQGMGDNDDDDDDDDTPACKTSPME